MSNKQDRETHVSEGRRRFMKDALAIGGGVLMSSLMSAEAVAAVAGAAKQYPKLGTYPAGSSGDRVFAGLVSPLTGAFSATGADLKKGYDLAFEQLNAGAGIGAKWPSLAGKKGVLGKQVEWQVADCETNPNVAVQLATRFIHQRNAVMIGGGTASSTAVALEKLAQSEKVIDMIGASGANATTGVDCQRYAFRPQVSAYMAGKALAPVLAKHLGKDRKAAYLVPDYNYGHSVASSTKRFTEAIGWKSVMTQVAPVGTTDYSSYLLNIANSGADVFVNVEFGNDSVASSQQAEQFGLLKKMKLVVPNISPFQAKSSGANVVAGMYGTVSFWWTLADKNQFARIFVDDFYKKYGYKPRWCAQQAYMQTFLWADAVSRAGTFYPPEVIKKLESGHKLMTSLGEVYYRAFDHQLVRAVPVVVGKKKADMKGPEDYFEIIGLVPGEDVIPPTSETMCKMPAYT
ncbi:MAG: substrate-binding protein [Rhodanobacteraceae bacterium]